jgi:ATP adenylyltransferase
MDHLYAPWRAEYLMNFDKKEDGCLFCNLLTDSNDRENLVLERTDLWYLMINRFPYTTGHLMLVCNRHIGWFSDLTDRENGEMTRMLVRSEKALVSAYNPHAANVGVNIGRDAGAGIEGHLHIHLVPRWQGDTNFLTAIGGTRVLSEALVDTFDKLKKALESI